MSDHERSRDWNRDSRREPRERNDRGGTPGDRRNRSRSPRRDRGVGGSGSARRDHNPRYRSRSPFRSDKGRGNGANGGPRVRDDRPRSPPKGPRSGNRQPPPPAAAAAAARSADPSNRVESPPSDTHMADARAKPADMDDGEWEVLCTMGFAGFKSTKNTKVPGNAKNYGVRKDKQMEARQYMNRQGGFNRPLSPGRS